MKIEQLYTQYQIPPNLQQHMLWTAALGQLVVQSWQADPIKKDQTILALLVHDMGNIVKFDLESDFSAKLLESQGQTLSRWQQVQQEFTAKYSADADQANIAIAQEVGLPELVIQLLKNHTFEQIPELVENQQWEHLICLYGDLRIGPHGLLSIKERIEDLRQRYLQRDHAWANKKLFEKRLSDSLWLEKKLNQRTKLNLSNLNQKQLDEMCQDLLELEFEI